MTPKGVSGWAAGPAAALPGIDRPRLADSLRALADNLPKKHKSLWPALHGAAHSVAPPSCDRILNDAASAAVGLTFTALTLAADCGTQALNTALEDDWPVAAHRLIHVAADMIADGNYVGLP